MGVKREKRVILAAWFRNSARVILPSLLLLQALRTMSSTRSISLIMFWKARTFAYDTLLPLVMLHRVLRFSKTWSDSLCFEVSRMMRSKSSGSMKPSSFLSNWRNACRMRSPCRPRSICENCW